MENGDRMTPEFQAEVALNKKRYLAELQTYNLNASKACIAMDVSRGTIRNWRIADTEFNQAVEDVMESMIDRAEEVLREALENPIDAVSTAQFLLKYKGRSRGYEGSTNILLSGDKKSPVTFAFADAVKGEN